MVQRHHGPRLRPVTTYVHLWTVAFALTLALGTGLNSVTLLSDLYTNGAFRLAVAGSATQMTDLAGRVLPNGPVDVATKMYTDDVNKAIADSKVTGIPAASGIDSEAAARRWFTEHVTDSTQQSAALAAFDQVLMDERVQDAAALRKILTSTSVDVRQFRWKCAAYRRPAEPRRAVLVQHAEAADWFAADSGEQTGCSE